VASHRTPVRRITHSARTLVRGGWGRRRDFKQRSVTNVTGRRPFRGGGGRLPAAPMPRSAFPLHPCRRHGHNPPVSGTACFPGDIAPAGVVGLGLWYSAEILTRVGESPLQGSAGICYSPSRSKTNLASVAPQTWPPVAPALSRLARGNHSRARASVASNRLRRHVPAQNVKGNPKALQLFGTDTNNANRPIVGKPSGNSLTILRRAVGPRRL